MSKGAPASHPCGSCPYRKDVPSGVWADHEYDKLPPYDENPGPPSAFFCHHDNGRLCAGWVGCHDMEGSLGLRVAALQGILDTEDVAAARDYVCPVPLWESGAAAAAHGKAEIENPGDDAIRTISKLQHRRARATR